MFRPKLIVIFLLFAIVVVVAALFCCPSIILPWQMSSDDAQIFYSLRAPRVFVAFLVGAALATAGTILQSILRNPLADPFILGISSGSALFAVLAIYLGSSLFGLFTVPLFAFIGALLVTVATLVWGWQRGTFWPLRLLLSGLGISFFLQALLTFILNIFSPEGLRGAIAWLSGDLTMVDWSLIPYALVFIVIGVVIAMVRAKAVNALMLGDELAITLGFAVHRERVLLFVAMSLMTAAAVSLVGIVGFVGLITPHVARSFVGASHERLLPIVTLLGGVFLVFSDMLARTLLHPTEIPVGVVTALLGAPYFLYLLRRENVLRQ
ncbi:MAG: iron ABC transporter permease [Oligoflexia bacterium]|nr:iron ABC transporter permease [Oligoflexia bacterium]MBF0364504.1 iron ABC transporter permease [Oligoflexia bacterium]